MLKVLFKKAKCDKGAFDKVLVTLLLVVISIVALVAVEQWYVNQRDGLVDESEQRVTNVLNENQ